LQLLTLRFVISGSGIAMAVVLPFRDINVIVSGSRYEFKSASSPSAPTLVVDRPTGDIGLKDGPLLGTKRISSIAGILGIIKLRLGKDPGVP
jgi:phosphatidylinositol 4-phosphatase